MVTHFVPFIPGDIFSSNRWDKYYYIPLDMAPMYEP